MLSKKNERRLAQEPCYLCKFRFIAKEIESADAVFSVIVIMVHDEAITTRSVSSPQSQTSRGSFGGTIPFACPGGHLDDCLLAADLPEASTVAFKHLVICVWLEATDVDIGCSVAVVQYLVETSTAAVLPAVYCGNRWWDSWLLLCPFPEVIVYIHTVWSFGHLLIVGILGLYR